MRKNQLRLGGLGYAPTSSLLCLGGPCLQCGIACDHTWVTTYDNRVKTYSNDQQVAAAGQCYWYCWGSFAPKGGTPNNSTGFLGQQNGDLALANCLVTANAIPRLCPQRAARFSSTVSTVYAINWPIRYSTRRASEARHR